MKTVMAILLVGLAATPLRAQPEVVDGVAAIVNGRVITYSEVRQYALPAVQQLSRDYHGEELLEHLQAAHRDALSTLIDRALIVDEYTEKGYQLPKNILDTQIDEIIAVDYNNDRRAFIKTLQAEGITMSQYRDRLRERIIVQAMSTRKLEQELMASPYQIEKYYEDHGEEFDEEEKIRLRMIYLTRLEPPTPMPAGWTDPHLRQAREIHGELAEGERFENLARLYSQAQEADQGGDWGWIERDILMKQLSDVAFSLEAGQHSEVIETETGYYILFVQDIKAAHRRPLTEVRPMIEKTIQQQQRSRIQKDWVEELRAKAFIRIF